MNFGFLVRSNPSGVAFEQVGEPTVTSQLLSVSLDDTVQTVFLGRLYYLDNLRRRLAAKWRLDPTASPADYVRAVYQQAGVEGLTWLEGDYSFVLWDARQCRLIGVRDPMGGFPLFWVRVREQIALSNAMRPLLDLLPERRINLDYLSEYLVLPFGGFQELHDERCAYEGIHRVLAGTRIDVAPGGLPETAHWWDWLPQMEEPASLRLEDVAIRYRALLEDAVDQRRIGRTAAHLSGGMDSTAIALLAARQAAAADEEPVHGLALVYERLGVLSRERPFVESVVGTPGLQLHRLNGDDCLDFDAYDDQTNPDEPVLSFYQSAMCHSLLKRAADMRVQTLLTGFGADELVGLQPFQLHDMLRSGRWLSAWREASSLATARCDSPWRYLGRYGLHYFLPAPLQGGIGCWRRGGRVAWERQQAYTIGPWVRPQFARQQGLWQRSVERLQSRSDRCRPLALSMALEALEFGVGDAFRWEVGAPNGVHVAQPFLDPRLVRFCLGFQGRISTDPNRQKPILADALRDVLPAVIRERPGKGHFNEVFFGGLARNLRSLEALVERAPVNDLEIVDKAELLCCLHKAALGVGECAPGWDRLNLTLSLLKWLTSQRESCDRPALSIRPFEISAKAWLSAKAWPVGPRPALLEGKSAS
jgi:asparagine synthase (glutamine-hydrolysing)